jgi:hypothetical protein
MTLDPVPPDVGADIDPQTLPSGAGCVECLAAEPTSWSTSGVVPPAATSAAVTRPPRQHAAGHYRKTGHRVIRSFEPGERWSYDYVTGLSFSGPEPAGPAARPADQPAPGPEGAVPTDWKSRLRS